MTGDTPERVKGPAVLCCAMSTSVIAWHGMAWHDVALGRIELAGMYFQGIGIDCCGVKVADLLPIIVLLILSLSLWIWDRVPPTARLSILPSTPSWLIRCHYSLDCTRTESRSPSPSPPDLPPPLPAP